MKKLIQAHRLSKTFYLKQFPFQAVNEVSFSLYEGETLAVVGESGSGKSTLAKLLLRLIPASEGSLFFEGEDFFSLPLKKCKPFRKKMQMIFQDPFASLNPRMIIKDLLEEPFKIHNIPFCSAHIKNLLSLVSMPYSSLGKYPHEFSGGQRQRIAIARAIALDPVFLICDEALSALDVSIQAQILELFVSLKKEKKLTYLFISHNLAQVQYIADRIMVMKRGKLIELQTTKELFQSPQKSYTKKLLDAARSLQIPYLEAKA